MNIQTIGFYIIIGLLTIITLYLIYDVSLRVLRYNKIIEGLEMNEETTGHKLGQEMNEEGIGHKFGQEMNEEEMNHKIGQEIVMKMTAEMTEATEEEMHKDPLENIINNKKTINFKYDKKIIDAKGASSTKPFYLAVIKKDDCEFALRGSKNECETMIAIAQPLKNEFSQFTIYNQTDDRGNKFYMIRSLLENTQPSHPYLSQLLHLADRGQNLCFGGGNDKDVQCYFEKNNDGYAIKFRKPIGNNTDNYNDYFVAECVGDQQKLCKQGQNVFTRLCLSNNKNQAIYFQIE